MLIGRKHRFTGLMISLLLAVIVSGCHGEPGPKTVAEPTSIAPPASPGAEVPASPKTVIVYARGMDETDATAHMIEAYNNQSEGIQVVYQELPYDPDTRYGQVSAVMAAGGGDYDVFDGSFVWTAEFAVKGYIMALDSLIAWDGIDTSLYMPGAMAAVTYEDQIWGLPQSVSAGVLYFRNDIVDTPPQTWDELVEQASDLQNAEDGLWGYVMAGRPSEDLVSEAAEFIHTYGGQIMDEKGRIVLDSPQSIAGLNQMREVFNSGIAPDTYTKLSESDTAAEFIRGDAVFMRNWSNNWSIANQSNSAVKDHFAIAPLPAGDAGSKTALRGVAAMLSAQSHYPEEAWDFIKFAAGFEGQKMNALEASKFPTLTAVLADTEVIAANPHFTSESFVAAITDAVPFPATPYHKELSYIMQDELYSFLVNKQEAEAAATNIKRRFLAIATPPTEHPSAY